MVDFLRHWLYALAAGGGAVLFGAGFMLDWSLSAVVMGWSLIILALGIWLERVIPFEPAWNRSQGDSATDAASALVLVGLVDPLAKAVLPIAALALWSRSEPVSGAASAWPLPVQMAAALAWMEFSKYWAHRLHHEVKPLWHLHALHHSSERLYWLNNFRFHPLNHLINATLSLLPLLLLGVPETALLGAMALTQPVLMLQHLNARLDSGCLNRIFSTNELHRWHHSSRPEEANANYGSALVLWDQLFGTYRRSGKDTAPARLGLFGDGHGYPAKASYWHQLCTGCAPACCRG